MRILGLDYGSKTVGVAISDPLLITAQGVDIIRRQSENKLRRTYARIEEIMARYGDVEKIVVGYPKNMNDTIGDRAQKSEEFKTALEQRCGLPVVLWDERLTTVAADRAMDEAGIKSSDHKKYVDEIAAMLILQGYLEWLRNSGQEKE